MKKKKNLKIEILKKQKIGIKRSPIFFVISNIVFFERAIHE